jgi:3-deoxy-D-manno-octulosonic-acid transferase
MFSFLYNCLALLGLIVYLPKILFDFSVKGKYRKSLLYRLGFKMPPFIKKEGERIIWIHAVSLGETKACCQLVQEIKKNHPSDRIVFSSGTETGHAEARKMIEEENAFYLPLDFSWNMRKLVQKVQPDVLILIETDFWFHLMHFAKMQGAKILLASGKISKKSTRFYSRFPKFSKELFSLIDLYCLQNNAYKKRFQTIGVPLEKILVTGNLKYDQDTPFLKTHDFQMWREKMGIYDGDRVITVASTHTNEEKLILDELKKVWLKESNLKVLLAPRHPERFVSVANLLKNENIPFVALSKLHHKTSTERVILIDSMGVLPVCYQLSELAIIAGSFQEKVGGHNILEPNFYQVPVFFGPHMWAQVELRKMVLNAKAGIQLELDELAPKVEEFFNDEALQRSMKSSAKVLVESLKGRKKETYSALKPYLLPAEKKHS